MLSSNGCCTPRLAMSAAGQGQDPVVGEVCHQGTTPRIWRLGAVLCRWSCEVRRVRRLVQGGRLHPNSELSRQGLLEERMIPASSAPARGMSEAPAGSGRRVDAAGPALGGDADHLGVRLDVQCCATAGARRRSSQFRGRRGSVVRVAAAPAGLPVTHGPGYDGQFFYRLSLRPVDPAPDRIWDHLG